MKAMLKRITKLEGQLQPDPLREETLDLSALSPEEKKRLEELSAIATSEGKFDPTLLSDSEAEECLAILTKCQKQNDPG